MCVDINVFSSYLHLQQQNELKSKTEVALFKKLMEIYGFTEQSETIALLGEMTHCIKLLECNRLN